RPSLSLFPYTTLFRSRLEVLLKRRRGLLGEFGVRAREFLTVGLGDVEHSRGGETHDSALLHELAVLISDRVAVGVQYLLSDRLRRQDRDPPFALLDVPTHVLPLVEAGHQSCSRPLDLNQELVRWGVVVEARHRVQVGLPMLVIAEVGNL